MPGETKTPKAILRVQKIKTRGQLVARSNHNNRTTKRGLEHTDPAGRISLIAGRANAETAWDARTKAVGFDTTKQRKDGVLALEWVASASREWWDEANPAQKTALVKNMLGFLAKEAGGIENICQAYLHADESTIHVQAITIPLIEKEIKARGRGSAGKPPRRQWCLSAKDYIGGSSHRLEELQTDYAAAIAHHGIERGTPRKETGARNLNPTKWRAQQARIQAQIEADSQQAAQSRKKARQALYEAEGYKQKAAAFMEDIQSTAAAFIKKFQDWPAPAADLARREMKEDLTEIIRETPRSLFQKRLKEKAAQPPQGPQDARTGPQRGQER